MTRILAITDISTYGDWSLTKSDPVERLKSRWFAYVNIRRWMSLHDFEVQSSLES